MNNPSFRLARLAGIAALTVCVGAIAVPAPDPALTAVVADPARSANFVARDKARHPVEELTFFGIAPTMTVVELWPGGGYWTEILGAIPCQRRHILRGATRTGGYRGGQDR